MTTHGIQVRDPHTGELVGVCPGPTSAGTCPFARKNGVVPCAGYMVSPPHADRRFWPLTVPVGHRYCEVGWNARALSCLAEAEACRAKWQAGAASETKRVAARAASGDPRYKRMTVSQLEKTGLWRWRLSTSAIQLAKAEEKQRERARLYLSFAEFRRLATLQAPRRRGVESGGQRG